MRGVKLYTMIKIFADGADKDEMIRLASDDRISGFTTNPSLMRKAGVTDYTAFCKELLEHIKKPISFEVFADDFEEMERQARLLASWGENVYVKIPIKNTKEESSCQLARKLLDDGIKVNLTAVFTRRHLTWIQEYINGTKTPHIVSVFAGRIADTGVDPMWTINYFEEFIEGELLWASTREVLNIYQAAEFGADIVTCTPDLLQKYFNLKDKDLEDVSSETVKQFYNDAKAAGYIL